MKLLDPLDLFCSREASPDGGEGDQREEGEEGERETGGGTEGGRERARGAGKDEKESEVEGEPGQALPRWEPSMLWLLMLPLDCPKLGNMVHLPLLSLCHCLLLFHLPSLLRPGGGGMFCLIRAILVLAGRLAYSWR